MTTDESATGAATDRRMRRIAMLTAVAAIAPLCVVGVALTAASWWEGLIIAVGMLLTLGVLREWNLDGYPRRAVFALMFTGSSWLVGALATTNPINFVPFALVGVLLLARARRRRWVAVAAFAVGVAIVGASALTTHPPTWPLSAMYVLLPAVGTMFVAAVIGASEEAWMLVRRLERAREAEAELAVERERVRFAGDLHDIQGHSLHMIKLTAAHAQALLRAGADGAPDAAADLVEIRRLVDDAIVRTRELAYARHELNLAAELTNTVRICEAADIAVQVHGDGGASSDPLLAQVLREATTNLLRHAHPSTVTITVSDGRLEIVNDGAHDVSVDGTGPPLRGLARLRDRVGRAGGTLEITRSPGRFALVADLDPSAVRTGVDA